MAAFFSFKEKSLENSNMVVRYMTENVQSSPSECWIQNKSIASDSEAYQVTVLIFAKMQCLNLNIGLFSLPSSLNSI